MTNHAATRFDWDDSDANNIPGASLIRGTAWAVTFSLPLWALMIWLCLKVF